MPRVAHSSHQKNMIKGCHKASSKQGSLLFSFFGGLNQNGHCFDCYASVCKLIIQATQFRFEHELGWVVAKPCSLILIIAFVRQLNCM